MASQTVADIVEANELLKEMEKDALAKLLKLNEHLTVIVYDYVSNTNLKDDGSQGGHVVLMTNK